MSPLEHDSYKAFFRAWLKAQPKQGHGILRKLALHLKVHTTMLTHVFRGESHLSMEHAVKVASFLGLDEPETEFFMNLVQRDRAGSVECRRYFDQQLAKAREKSQKLKNRLERRSELGEESRARFYSDWTYSAAHLLQAIEGFDTPRAISDFLRLPPSETRKILSFLVESGLSEEKGGRYRIGTASTFLPSDSPFSRQFQRNWRLRVLQQSHDLRDEELAFTNPVVVRHDDFAKIRERLIELIKDFGRVAEPSACETLACLNIDWVKLR